jgi:hypothetical protein
MERFATDCPYATLVPHWWGRALSILGWAERLCGVKRRSRVHLPVKIVRQPRF